MALKKALLASSHSLIKVQSKKELSALSKESEKDWQAWSSNPSLEYVTAFHQQHKEFETATMITSLRIWRLCATQEFSTPTGTSSNNTPDKIPSFTTSLAKLTLCKRRLQYYMVLTNTAKANCWPFYNPLLCWLISTVNKSKISSNIPSWRSK